MNKFTLLWLMLFLFSINLSLNAQIGVPTQNGTTNIVSGVQFYNYYQNAVEDKKAILMANPILYQEALNNGWFNQVAVGLQNAQNSANGNTQINFIGGGASMGGATCSDMQPFCTGVGATYPAGVNTGAAEAGPNYGCLQTRPNPVWYYMKILTGGNLDITQTNSNNIDVDFILWGPFPNTDVCGQLTANKIVDCSYNPQATEYINITNSQPGEYYILLVTNFSNNPTNITLAKTGGNATTDCAIVNPSPSVPVATPATLITSSSFRANWNSSSNTTGYRLDVSTDAGFSSLVSGFNNLDVNNVTNYIVTGLTPGTTYYYRVRAYNPNATSANSNVITVLTAPSSPIATSATSIAANTFIANWNSAPSATNYLLDVATDIGFTNIVTGYNGKNVGNVTTSQVTGLTTCITHYFRVRAVNASGISGNSNIITVLVAPANPVATAATNMNVTSFNANWNVVSCATDYRIDVATDSAFTFIMPAYNNLNTGNVTTYSVFGLNANTPYFYRVRAINTNGASQNSNVIRVKRTPIITWANPNDIIYGTPLSAAQLNAQANVAGSWSYTPSSGTVLNSGNNVPLSVTFTPNDTENYNNITHVVYINVTKITPIITWNNPSGIIYGTPLSATQLNATTTIAGTWSYTPATGAVLNAGASQNLSTTFTPNDLVNYNVVSKTVQINVAKADPLLTWNNPANITYGTVLSNTQLNATSNVPGTWQYSPHSGTIPNAGLNQNLTVTFTPTDINNYNVKDKVVQINVLKANPVIIWSNPSDISYGTPLGTTQLNATANIPGLFTYNPALGAILNAGANQNLAVSFSPIDTVNYNSVNKTVNINVIKANPVTNWPYPANIIYGTALGATQLNASASVPGTWVYTPATGAVLNAGNNQVLSATFTPTNLANYNVLSITTLINVIKANPIITWNNPTDIVYGTALGATQLNATANVPGTFAYTPASGTVLNAGNNQVLTTIFTPTNTGNYNIVNASVSINVNKANPVITWSNPADIVYGTPLSNVQLNATANIPGTWLYYPHSGTVLNAGPNQNITATFTPTNISNYNVIDKTVQINVLKANPVIVWNNPADLPYGVPLSGLQLNATANVPGAWNYSPAAGTVLNAGLNQNLNTTFTPSDANNYNIVNKIVQINIVNPAPTIQAEITEFTHITGTAFDVKWTRGDGDFCNVYISQTNVGQASPIVNTNYTADSEFGLGSEISFTNWYSIYEGTGTSVYVTGLRPGVIYRVMVVEYNEYYGYKNYNTTTNIKNPLNVKTLDAINSNTNIGANNYISPNGDGVNDKWVIARVDELKDYDLYIFNNIGETLYQSRGYDNSWEATYNARPLPSGTYYYIFKDGGNIVLKGFITVVR